MAQYFTMPGLSADAEEALLEDWLIKEGDELSEGSPIATVETDKAVVDIDINDDGVVHALLVETGTSVPVGDPILVLRGADEDPAEADRLTALAKGQDAPMKEESAPAEAPASDSTTEKSEPAPEQPAPAPVADAAPAPAASGGGRLFVTPIVRRLAREQGIDLTTITGTGKNGRIIRRDFEKAVAERGSQPQTLAPAASEDPAAKPAEQASSIDVSVYPGAEFVEHSRLRKVVARRLQQSKREAPHFYLRRSVKVDDLLALRKQLNENSPVRISVNDLVVKAAAKALAEFPEVNTVWDDAGAYRLADVDVAVAVASERGLVTPVVRKADQLALSALSSSIKDLASRANENRLKQDELVGGALTVSNLGMFGVEDFDAIINPPQAAILAVGSASPQPIVVDGELAIGTIMKLSLSVDHRSVDGALGAQFLARIVEQLESPFSLLI
ncbi:dihydrolipoamide acetyltransferase family protein [Flaviflexus massiliensis]|uniref:dihydrolipoamide acetyltransferase family protein n=1 Tax=Flaviflexus massiliensis TaxID=1522309 RepID=UPI0006D57F86|nr:dihydrolipoamide acetyltransferase family protein [Flaviflexus massiliensis]